MSKRCERRSLIAATNLESSGWGSVLAGDQMAAAMIGGIVRCGRLAVFEGPAKGMGSSPMARRR